MPLEDLEINRLHPAASSQMRGLHASHTTQIDVRPTNHQTPTEGLCTPE